MFSLCPSASHHFSWTLGVFELSREEAVGERRMRSCWNQPVCCLKFSVADVCTAAHREGRAPSLILKMVRTALQLSPYPFLSLHPDSVTFSPTLWTTLIQTSVALCLPWLFTLTSCIIVHVCAGVSQRGLARRGAIAMSGGAGEGWAGPGGRFVTLLW